MLWFKAHHEKAHIYATVHHETALPYILNITGPQSLSSSVDIPSWKAYFMKSANKLDG